MSAIFGETLTFPQENGPEVELVVFGDEFYSRRETKDGYTVIYDDKLGQYGYAILCEGEFASSGIPISAYRLAFSIVILMAFWILDFRENLNSTQGVNYECHIWRNPNLPTRQWTRRGTGRLRG